MFVYNYHETKNFAALKDNNLVVLLFCIYMHHTVLEIAQNPRSNRRAASLFTYQTHIRFSYTYSDRLKKKHKGQRSAVVVVVAVIPL